MDKRRYWDSSVFLCFLNAEEEERRIVCEDILQHAAKEEFQIVTSTYTVVEVIRPWRRSTSRVLTPEQIAKIKGMFRWPFITTIELDDRTALYASDLSREYGLKPADAVHAASAILWKAEVLQAWDRDFSAVSQLIIVEEPRFLSAQRSFDEMRAKPIGPTAKDFEETK